MDKDDEKLRNLDKGIGLQILEPSEIALEVKRKKSVNVPIKKKKDSIVRNENYSLSNLRGVSPDFLANKIKSTSPNEKMMLSKNSKTRNNSHSKTQIKAGKMITNTSQGSLKNKMT